MLGSIKTLVIGWKGSLFCFLIYLGLTNNLTCYAFSDFKRSVLKVMCLQTLLQIKPESIKILFKCEICLERAAKLCCNNFSKSNCHCVIKYECNSI